MQNQASAFQTRKVQVADTEIEIWQGGVGRTILLLHPGDGFDPDTSYVAELTSRFSVIAPSCPGFGRSAKPPDWMKSVDDLSYFYLDLLEVLDLQDLIVVGLSFGGWLCAEMAVKNTSRIAAMCLVDTLGAKFAAPMTREITDLFSVPLYQHPQWIYHDEKLRSKSYQGLSDEAAEIFARNYQTFGLFGWAPTLHSRHLHHRLHRIGIPTQLIWGAEDRVVSVDYARQWQKALNNVQLTVIDNAGHYPQIEQPQQFVAVLERFVNNLT